ncbi:MAG: hypothetical protein IT585_00680 [candidate division Zixibacteria bacterium]|nr:hypothetical protein [candidate division Zixibacteria bacterium]
MSTILVVFGIVVAAIILLRFLGSGYITKKTMMASYFAARESLGPDVAEEEVLCSVLKTRPPFRRYTEEMLRDIVAMCPDINALTAFVIGFDKHKTR